MTDKDRVVYIFALCKRAKIYTTLTTVTNLSVMMNLYCDLGPDNCLSRSNGVHTLKVGSEQHPIQVYCDAGWTVCVKSSLFNR